MAHVYCLSAMDPSAVLTAKAIRPTSAFGMEHCKQLMVDVSVSDKIELPSRSAYAISPTFSIADILKPSSQAHPSVQMDLLSTNTNGNLSINGHITKEDCVSSEACSVQMDPSPTLNFPNKNTTIDRECQLTDNEQPSPVTRAGEELKCTVENNDDANLDADASSTFVELKPCIATGSPSLGYYDAVCRPMQLGKCGSSEFSTSDATTLTSEIHLTRSEVIHTSINVEQQQTYASSTHAMNNGDGFRKAIYSCLSPLPDAGEKQLFESAVNSRTQCSNCGSPSQHAASSVFLPNLSNTVNDLLDAARCVQAETQLEEAQAVLDRLIAKFAQPLDLYTAWGNLSRGYHEEDFPMLNETVHTRTTPCYPTSFSPIFKLLLSQPESHIFPELCQSTASGRHLQELCNRLASAIHRTKRKLRVLQRMKARRVHYDKEINGGTGPRHVAPAESVSSEQEQRRSTFLDRLRHIWPGAQQQYPQQQNLTDVKSPTQQTSKPVRSNGIQTEPYNETHPEAPERVLPIWSKPLPLVYTNPLECPLSLLSFVSSSKLLHQTSFGIALENHSAAKSSSSEVHSDPIAGEYVQHSTGDLNTQMSNTVEGTNCLSLPSPWPNLVTSQAQLVTLTESPNSSNLSFLSASLSPSSCSTNSCGQATSSPVRRNGTRRKLSQMLSHPFQLSATSEPTSKQHRNAGRSRSSKACRKFGSAINQDSSEPTNKSGDLWTNVSSVDKSSAIAGFGSSLEHAPQLNLPSPIRVGAKWTQLHVLVRDSDDSPGWTVKTDVEPSSTPGTLSPSSVSCVPTAMHPAVSGMSFPTLSIPNPAGTPVPHLPADDHDGRTNSCAEQSMIPVQTRRDPEQCSSHSLSSNAGEPYWTNMRPPTPDIRRSDLDIGDLSDGTRVLVIQDTHLRAGTLYLDNQSVIETGSTSSVSLANLPAESRRDQLFRINLDFDRSGLPSANTSTKHASSSPARFSSELVVNHNSRTTPIASKKRRQSDLILYGWQVVQQAVLEVFPASIRHLPPGTRVCASWSEQLACNLYPGTVVESETESQMQPGCVAVDFDDGDHRQVPIHNIRMLPDHFTNLYELANSTDDQELVNQLIQVTSPTRLPVTTDTKRRAFDGMLRAGTRVRHHSAVDGASGSGSHGTMQHLSPQMDSKRVWQRMTRQLSPSGVPRKLVRQINGSQPTSSSGVSGIMSTTSFTSKESLSPQTFSSVSPIATALQTGDGTSVNLSFTTSSETHSFPAISSSPRTTTDQPGSPRVSDALTPSCSTLLNTAASEVTCIDLSHFMELDDSNASLLVDHEARSDTASTGSGVTEANTWHILEKLRRRRHGHTYCRSIVREADGLVVSTGDAVEFSSGENEAYLGEVREIRWDDTMDSAVVTAACLNIPPHFTIHRLFNNAAIRASTNMGVKPVYKIGPDERMTDEFHPGSTAKESGLFKLLGASTFRQLERSGTIQSNEHSDAHTRDSGMFELNCAQESQVSSDSETTTTTSTNTSDSVYFIAGKYDPVNRRVTAWDPDVPKPHAQRLKRRPTNS
ncbi:hypothetical protein EG68_01108 [Paragonimus skrjabini miyazakii]|uniref:BAHCC1-like Tudor domain-containing protein n=1 Tax=Paragonimus skrjabini miyazakii TaxID=59628 RepID=A0A8S9Z6J5_9TREM|nr:hypothetical protein EG68_01108 [Paragonimus skrjabini miyazakii]